MEWTRSYSNGYSSLFKGHYCGVVLVLKWYWSRKICVIVLMCKTQLLLITLASKSKVLSLHHALPEADSRFSSHSFLGHSFSFSAHVMLPHMLVLLLEFSFLSMALHNTPIHLLNSSVISASLWNLIVHRLYIFKSLVLFLMIEMIQCCIFLLITWEALESSVFF